MAGHILAELRFLDLMDIRVDGIPASWLIRNFGATNAPGGAATDDPDEDGYDNYAEYVAGTVPTDGASVLRILGVVPQGAGLKVRFDGVQGRRYRLDYTGALPPPGWTALTTNFPGTNGEVQITDPIPFLRDSTGLESGWNDGPGHG
jgi:hypothetical protein